MSVQIFMRFDAWEHAQNAPNVREEERERRIIIIIIIIIKAASGLGRALAHAASGGLRGRGGTGRGVTHTRGRTISPAQNVILIQSTVSSFRHAFYNSLVHQMVALLHMGSSFA